MSTVYLRPIHQPVGIELEHTAVYHKALWYIPYAFTPETIIYCPFSYAL